ncbi:MAG: 16S rRNA (guanine(527)-N(7))-methyltransferase RsmG [Clostridia bacterium]|nr:16S rRNA (guanine(527)-N(7))-methyltransferase RsmG [Clostridia bacterium]
MSITTDILTATGFNEETANKFDTYYKLLIEWNEKINLTAITEEREAALKHFVDSVKALDCGLFAENAKIIDVGTGAGFPGLPLKIYRDDLKVTLMDSLNKRINFLNEVISALNLTGIETIHARAEELARNKAHREKYDICVSRAVANLASLTELCMPFVKVGGYFVSLKGPKAEEEVEAAKKAIELLGGEFVEIKNYAIDETDLEHNLVIIKKIKPCEKRFPRNAPKPIKEPLK